MTRIGIVGYGNLGRGVEIATKEADDMELVAVSTRRDPQNVSIISKDVLVLKVDDVEDWKDKIEKIVLIFAP